MNELSETLEQVNSTLPINLGDVKMPLDMNIRSIALTLAAKYVTDTCVKEGGLYQQLKMDNKLGHVITLNDVVHAVLIFERYLWGEWSKDLAGKAMAHALKEIDGEIRGQVKPNIDEAEAETNAELKDEINDDPIRSSSGGAV